MSKWWNSLVGKEGKPNLGSPIKAPDPLAVSALAPPPAGACAQPCDGAADDGPLLLGDAADFLDDVDTAGAVQEVEIRFSCPMCRESWLPPGPDGFKCPRCKVLVEIKEERVDFRGGTKSAPGSFLNPKYVNPASFKSGSIKEPNSAAPTPTTSFAAPDMGAHVEEDSVRPSANGGADSNWSAPHGAADNAAGYDWQPPDGGGNSVSAGAAPFVPGSGPGATMYPWMMGMQSYFDPAGAALSPPAGCAAAGCGDGPLPSSLTSMGPDYMQGLALQLEHESQYYSMLAEQCKSFATQRRMSEGGGATPAGRPVAGSNGHAVGGKGGNATKVPDIAVGPDDWTTVMLRNIPNDYSRSMLLDLLDERFKRKYNFVYLPIDFKRKAGLGYAFVNLVSNAEAKRFMETFQGFNDWKFSSQKICEATWGNPLQGLEQHIERYKNSPLMHEDVPDEFKPILFDEHGNQKLFDPPTKRIRPPRFKLQEKPDKSGGGNTPAGGS